MIGYLVICQDWRYCIMVQLDKEKIFGVNKESHSNTIVQYYPMPGDIKGSRISKPINEIVHSLSCLSHSKL